MLAGLGLDQLRGDADSVPGFAQAAFEHIAHAELMPDLFHIDRARAQRHRHERATLITPKQRANLPVETKAFDPGDVTFSERLDGSHVPRMFCNL